MKRLFVTITALTLLNAQVAHAVMLTAGTACIMDRSGCTMACAPEVVEGNIKAADRVLKEIAARPDFTEATTFRSEVAKITAIDASNSRGLQQKTNAFLELVGVDPQDSTAVVSFISGQVTRAHVDTMKANLRLTEAQAKLVVLSLGSALKPKLQN